VNLVFRFLWMMLRVHLGPRDVDFLTTGEMTFRCWPHDLDINFHMTNSRYNSFMDIGRIGFMFRHGGWSKIRKAGLFPVLGSIATRFRRPVNPFQKFTVATRIASWDDRWLYIEQKIIAGGETASITLCKTLFVGKGKRVPTDELLRIVGYTGPRPAFAESLATYDKLDSLLVA
jgi:acyl-CoA thioesterase FadM